VYQCVCYLVLYHRHTTASLRERVYRQSPVLLQCIHVAKQECTANVNALHNMNAVYRHESFLHSFPRYSQRAVDLGPVCCSRDCHSLQAVYRHACSLLCSVSVSYVSYVVCETQYLTDRHTWSVQVVYRYDHSHVCNDSRQSRLQDTGAECGM